MTFREILDELRIIYQTEGEQGCRPGWINLVCPWCHGEDEGKFYLGYSITDNYATCWRCGYRSLGEILVASGNVTWDVAKKWLGGLDEIEKTQIKKLGRLELPKGIGPLTAAHKNYLRERGFDPKALVRLWDISGIGVAAKLSWRIFIPFYYRGEVVSWTTRTIGKSSAKYVSASATQEARPHKSLLYGEDFVQHSIIVCYSKDTEVLTKRGWVKFPKLSSKDVVAQYTNSGLKDGGIGCIHFVKPKQIQQFEFKGGMVHLSADWCDLLVTPDHRMLTVRQRCYPKVMKAEDIYSGVLLPVAGIRNLQASNLSPTPMQARLLVAYAADGHWEKRGFKCQWQFYKKRKQDRFRKILQKLRIPYKETASRTKPGAVSFRVLKNSIPFIEQFGPKKQWPWECLNWTLEARRAAVRELCRWDGDKTSKKTFRLFTSKKRTADVTSALAATSGFGAMARCKTSNNPLWSDEWTVHFADKQWRVFGRNPTTIQYNDLVYCCTVQSGFIVVRRNGKVTIAGNCEGPLDTWKIGPGAVATCGVGFSAAQVMRLSRYPKRIVCFDPDKAGQDRAEQLCDQLEVFPGETTNVVLDSGDPGDASAKEIKQLRRMLK